MAQTTLNNPASKLKIRGLTGATAVKTTGASLVGLTVINTSAAAAYIQLFDAVVASVTLGTTTPDKEFQVATNPGFLYAVIPASGIAFGTALTIASTTTEAGATVSAAGVMAFVEFL